MILTHSLRPSPRNQPRRRDSWPLPTPPLGVKVPIEPWASPFPRGAFGGASQSISGQSGPEGVDRAGFSPIAVKIAIRTEPWADPLFP